MSSSEFEQRLGAEPRVVVEELRAAEARGETVDPERRSAAKAAEDFEDRLAKALRLPADEDTLVNAALAAASPNPALRKPPAWLAMAASVALLAGIAGLTWYASLPVSDDVGRYVENHYRHDGADVLARAGEGATAEDVRAVMASLGASASEELAARVRYIKFCPTPDSRGAHMVVSTDDGPATVIFMPAVSVDAPMLVRFDGVEAQVIGLTTGSAAIIGADEAAARSLRASLEAGVLPLGADT